MAWAFVTLLVQLALVLPCWRWARRVKDVAGQAKRVRAALSRTADEATLEPASQELVSELRAAPSTDVARAVLNEALADVAEVLESPGTRFAAAARSALFSGTAIGLVALALDLRAEGAPGFQQGFHAIPVLLGMLGFGTARWLGRRAEELAREGRKSWNDLARRPIPDAPPAVERAD